MGKQVLGEFEQIVMLSVLRLGADAFGRRVYEEIERLAVTPVTITAVYVTLSRLVKKGMATVTLEPPPGGGRAQKRFALAPDGVAALQRSRQQLERFWDGVELDAEAGR